MTTNTITPTTPTISKRLRFAILTRDNHTCTYCGARPEDGITLVVDHVQPVALGGLTVPENLRTACAPCNSGKTSTSPDERRVAAVALDAERWADAIRLAALDARADKLTARIPIDTWRSRWDEWLVDGKDTVPVPRDWDASIGSMLDAGASITELIELIDVAMNSRAKDVFRYFCGCGWNHVRDLQARAREIFQAAENPGEVPHSGFATAADEAYWSGHVSGYSAGYDDAWEAGLAAGRAERSPADAPTDPLPLAQVLADLTPPREET